MSIAKLLKFACVAERVDVLPLQQLTAMIIIMFHIKRNIPSARAAAYRNQMAAVAASTTATSHRDAKTTARTRACSA
jgi:hypothetical protein